jgi:D-glucuronyl C5-epimerase-like protein
MTFGEDPAIFEYRPGQGLQYHPLANAGKASALAAACVRGVKAKASAGGPGVTPAPPQKLPRHCHRKRVRRALDRLLALASNRGGFTAWEYEFRYGAGAPPWISGMAQATAAQALARGAAAFGDERYRKAALDSLRAFELPPPLGVNDHGTFLMYSFDPGLHILNGFLQAVIGLHDVARLTRSKRAQRLFERSERVARRSIGAYDTGAWSLYSYKGREAPLNYERLVTQFLGRLCDRTDRAAYCSASRRFTRYLHEPPRIAVLTRGPRKARHREVTAYRISKVSRVLVSVRSRGHVLVRRSAQLPRGRYTFAWTPARGGRYLVRIQATGPEGHTGAVRETLRVKAPPKPKKPKKRKHTRKPQLTGAVGDGAAGGAPTPPPPAAGSAPVAPTATSPS